MEVLEIKPCKGVKNELEVQNPGVELNDACNIVPKGCLLLKDPCNSLEVSLNICQRLQTNEFSQLKMFNRDRERKNNSQMRNLKQ